MVNKQKANVCRPWTPCFEIKEESIVTSEEKTKIKICEIIFFFYFEKEKCWQICKPENKKEVA